MTKKIVCFGDSNTWGHRGDKKGRFTEEERWPSLLQKMVDQKKFTILEEGKSGRTTAFDEPNQNDRNGFVYLKEWLQNHSFDYAVVMLGTNDLKKCFQRTNEQLAQGMGKIIDLFLKCVPSSHILLVSPIHMAPGAWLPENDPSMDELSVEKSKELFDIYSSLAAERNIRIMDASTVASPCKEDYEHLNLDGHKALAKAVYEELSSMGVICFE